MDNRKPRRGQMEIMGIAIIMVLFSMGLLFFLAFSMKPASQLREHVDLTTFAANFVTTLLRTTTECNEATVEALLKDMVSYNQPLLCEIDGRTSGGHLAALDGPLERILSESFEKRYPEFDYILIYCPWDNDIGGDGVQGCQCDSAWDDVRKKCTADDDEQTLIRKTKEGGQHCSTYSNKIQSIPTDRGVMTLAFYVCERTVS